VVYSAAAEVLMYKDGFLDGKAPVVTYKPELKHSTWQFPSNAEGAKAAAKPTVSALLSDSGEPVCMYQPLASVTRMHLRMRL
jgi:hypothetical protein